MKNIVVASVLANKHRSAGAIWTSLSWALGLRQLGFEVYFFEQIERVDPESLAVFSEVTERYGFGKTCSLMLASGDVAHGLGSRDVLRIAESAEALVNISGHIAIPALLKAFTRKIYIDLDPGFTQIWEATGVAGARLDGHDFHFTIGENIGRPDCLIPTCGRDWLPIRQPALLDLWPCVPPEESGRFTTIASWRGPYGPLEYGGLRLGVKAHEWRKFLDLPLRVAGEFEVALDIHPADGKDLDALRQSGWRIVDPQSVAPDVTSMQRYIQSSSAEFSVAQGVYVATNSGWISDRTVCYLASGRPALVQDTGFSGNCTVGEGLVPFRTMEEAVASAADITRRHADHCAAAREIAERDFAAEKVLNRLIEQVGIAP